jgi:hypothetical protein
VELDESELAAESANARNLIEDELERRPQTISSTHQACSSIYVLSDAEVATMRDKIPFLREMSDGFIRSMPPQDLLKLESTSLRIREAERMKDAEDKLAANRASLGSRPKEVKAGLDDRWNILHDARFLPGAGCSATKLWLRAREAVGLTGHEAIGNYDMAAVGLGGFVTAKGWLELANPASTRLSIKLFNINNCATRAAKTSSLETEELLDFAELGEFKLALRTMKAAMRFIMPWNLSVDALDGFLQNTRFCKDDLSGLDKQAQLLTQFSDYVLAENANRWRNMEAFLTAGELKTTWTSFFSARPQSALVKKSSHNGSSSSFKGKQSSFKKPDEKRSSTAKKFVDVCWQWNSGTCSRTAGGCKSKFGTPLRHVCDFRPDPNNDSKICGEAHQRKDVHK